MTATAAQHSVSREITVDELCGPEFWRDLNPHLTIGGQDSGGLTAPRQGLERLRARMARDGYFGETDAELERLTPMIGEAVKVCAGAGLPPVFIFLYDQPWTCFQRLSPVIGDLLGADYKLLPDFWAWHVDPLKSESGWRPHRDKNSGALNPDGTPRSLTVWIPLSEANPLNSCIYLLPAHLDPLYGAPPSPNLPPVFSARALPVKPGDWLCWNQAVLHWGSASSEFAESPRMSMALEFQRGDIAPFNNPLLAQAPLPTYDFRLRLVAKQILQYRHMYGFSDALTGLATYILGRPA
ncbi:MAG: hypothetical protein JWM33_3587 [Caulobacteraceae bacterium]|nr:hypothetical protein [Caulobacteraceae bacterium]